MQKVQSACELKTNGYEQADISECLAIIKYIQVKVFHSYKKSEFLKF